MKKTLERRLILSAAAAGLLIASVGSGFAALPLMLEFVTHAAFFSAETKQPKTLDPQVFVEDTSAPEATGPQGIKHVAGVRPALVDQDAKTSKLFNAEHKPLGFDLQSWLSATGTVTIAEKDGKVTLDATFKNLQPNASHSLFENHFDTKPITFTPMDGAGKTNSLTVKADGTASITVTLPSMPTHDNAVLVIYNSGGQPHGMERGRIGVDAHHQISRGRSDPKVPLEGDRPRPPSRSAPKEQLPDDAARLIDAIAQLSASFPELRRSQAVATAQAISREAGARFARPRLDEGSPARSLGASP